MYELQFGDTLVKLPWWWFDALVAWLALIGLILWLFGRRLVRPALGLLGLAIGAVVTLVVINQTGHFGPRWAWSLAGGLVLAFLMGLLLWRVALALVLTALVVVAAPWGVISATDMEKPPVWEPMAEAATDFREMIGRSFVSGPVDQSNPDGEESGGEGESNPEEAGEEADASDSGIDAARAAKLLEPITAGYHNVIEAWSGWWDELPSKRQYWVLGAAVGGGVLALLLGLALPGIASALVAALLGVLLMIPGIDRLLGMLPEDTRASIPTEPHYVMIAILIAMLIGALLQGTVFRKATQ